MSNQNQIVSRSVGFLVLSIASGLSLWAGKELLGAIFLCSSYIFDAIKGLEPRDLSDE